jgi:hypothetical protein
MSWKLKTLITLCVALPLLIGLILWDEARKEVFFLCENFEPGHALANVVRQLDTAHYLKVNTDQHQWGKSITVSSVFGPLTRTCLIEFDENQQVRFAAVTPLHSQRLTLSGQPLKWASKESQSLAPNQLTLSAPSEVIKQLNAEPGMVFVSLEDEGTDSAKKLRLALETTFNRETRRNQLRRIVTYYPSLCQWPLEVSRDTAAYAKDNFAGVAWAESDHCSSNQQRRLEHQVESVFRQF